MPTIESKLIDIAAKGLRLYDGKTTDWVPKRLVEDNRDGTFTMPEWLAKEKGFI